MALWYIKYKNGQVEGPYIEPQIKRGFDRGKITSDMQIRQDNSPWTSSARVQNLFEQLDEQGYFLRDQSNFVTGPFTKQRVLALQAAGAITRYWIRQGKENNWTPINSPQLKPKQDVAAMAQAESKNTVVLPRKLVPAAPVMRLRNNSIVERLRAVVEWCEYAILGDPLVNRQPHDNYRVGRSVRNSRNA